MKSPLFALALALALALAVGLAAHAQAAEPDPLYAALGAQPGLMKLADDFVQRLAADPRTAPHFKDTNRAQLKQRLFEQFCQVSGGPCSYGGADMRTAHASMDIRKSDFNALVEVLQEAMDAQGIAFRAQNGLLARLAPMHRDIITVR